MNVEEEHVIDADWEAWCSTCSQSVHEGEKIGWDPSKPRGKRIRCSVCLFKANKIKHGEVSLLKLRLIADRLPDPSRKASRVLLDLVQEDEPTKIRWGDDGFDLLMSEEPYERDPRARNGGWIANPRERGET